MERKEIIKISIIALVLGVLTSFFYPQGEDLSMPWPVLFNFILEMFYYALIISMFDNSTGFVEHLVYAGGSFIFRVITSLVFAAAITTAHGISFTESIRLGIVGYLPQVFSMILVSPWVLLSFLKDSYKEKVRSISKPDVPVYEKKVRKQMEEIQQEKERILEPEKPVEGDMSVEGVLDYVSGGRGVVGSMISSREGLLLAYRFRTQKKAEEWAARLEKIFVSNDSMMHHYGVGMLKNAEFLAGDFNIGIYDVSGIRLIVIVQASATDNLISIRIARAVEMLGKVVKSRYGNVIASEV
ncbi:MAG: hypothetical protein GF307_05030 [candidate division Zixibacteria bacterium]|nr:hypothetical protein [candidate division Zixibacteria bacterium]